MRFWTAFVIFLLCSAHATQYQLPSQVQWLSAEKDTVFAVLDSGEVWKITPEQQVNMGMMSPFSPVVVCAGEKYAINSQDKLQKLGGLYTVKVARHSTPMCIHDRLVALAPEGKGVYVFDKYLRLLKFQALDVLPNSALSRSFFTETGEIVVLTQPKTIAAPNAVGNTQEASGFTLLRPSDLKPLYTYTLPEGKTFNTLRTFMLQSGVIATTAQGLVYAEWQNGDWTTHITPHSGWMNIAGINQDAVYAVSYRTLPAELLRMALPERSIQQFSGFNVSNHLSGSVNLQQSLLMENQLFVPTSNYRRLRLYDCAKTCILTRDWLLTANISSNIISLMWNARPSFAFADASGKVHLYPIPQ